MPSQINPNQFDDGQPVSKSALRDTLSTVKGELEHGGFTQIAPGAPMRRVSDRLGDLVNVKDFGAVGDGTTDDSAAFQAAIDACSRTGAKEGTTLFIPKGNFKINTGLVISHSVDIRGALGGHQANDAPRLTFAPGVTGITIDVTKTNFETIRISGMSMWGGITAIHLTKTDATDLKFISRNSTLSDIFFASQTHSGLRLEANYIGCSFYNLNFENTGDYGVYSRGISLGNNACFYSCRARSAKIAGFHFESLHLPPSGDEFNIGLFNCISEGNAGAGLYLKSVGVHLYNCWFESNGNAQGTIHDIHLDSNQSGGKVTTTVCTLHECKFSVRRNTTRVKFFNSGVRLASHNVQWLNGDVIDENGKRPHGSRVVLGSAQTDVKVINGDISADLNGNSPHVLGTPTVVGISPTPLGISVNAGGLGGVALIMASLQTGAGNATQSALYFVRCGYDGNNYTAQFVAGTSDFLTFSIDNGDLMASVAAGACAVTVLTNRGAFMV